MRQAKSIRKHIRQIVIQGNQREIQNLFYEIYAAHADEFREDNRPTLDSFLQENLQNAANRFWGRVSAKGNA